MAVTSANDDGLQQLLCAHHRRSNRAPHGRETKEIFARLLQAKPLEDIARIKQYDPFSGLSEVANIVQTSVDDSVQYLTACVANGGRTYGRTTSQAVESMKANIKKAISVDLLTSILTACLYRKETFEKFAVQSLSRSADLPPAQITEFNELRSLGMMTDCPRRSSDLKNV